MPEKQKNSLFMTVKLRMTFKKSNFDSLTVGSNPAGPAILKIK